MRITLRWPAMLGLLVCIILGSSGQALAATTVTVPAGVPEGTPAGPLPNARLAAITYSGIQVQEGQTYIVRATGTARGRDDYPEFNANGAPAGTIDPDSGPRSGGIFPEVVGPPANIYALLGTISDVAHGGTPQVTGDGDEWFLIGTDRTFTATRDGELAFVVNDGLYRPEQPTFFVPSWRDTYLDNSGGFDVTVDTPSQVVSIGGTRAEGDAGEGVLAVDVGFDHPTPVPVTVSWETTAPGPGSDPAEAEDYVPASGTITISPAGQVSPPRTTPRGAVTVIGDTRFEGSEAIGLRITDVTGATIAPGASDGEALIENDDAAPELTTTSASVPEGDAPALRDVHFALDRASDFPIALSLFTPSGGTATPNVDYEPVDGTTEPQVTFAPGTTDASFPVRILGDTVYEGTPAGADEGFTLFTSAQGTGISLDREIPVTIVEDDPAPIVGFCPQGTGTLEGAPGDRNVAYLEICAQGAGDQPIQVEYATSNDTAVAGEDYQGASGTVMIPANNTGIITIPVTLLGDAVVEPNEFFFLTLTGAYGAVIDGSTRTFSVRIYDDDTVTPPSATVSIADSQVTEGDTGTKGVKFTLNRTGSLAQAATIRWHTADGTAVSGGDYQAQVGKTVRFAAGAATVTVSVPVIGDRIDESDETFRVLLDSSTGAPVGDGEGVGTILDDDPPALTIDDASVAEGNRGTKVMTFVVHLSRNWNVPVTAAWTTGDLTTVAGSDYVAATGTVTIPANSRTAKVTVVVNGDRSVEPDERFRIVLSAPTNAVITDAEAVGTIRNDD